MPELPEVQTVADDLNRARIKNKTITRARVYWPKTIAGLSPKAFARRMKGEQFTRIFRRAKYLIFELKSGEAMIVHFRMTGRLHIHPAEEERSKHEHVVIGFEDGRELRLHDSRKFARVNLVKDPEDLLGRLGPEPLEPAFTLSRFRAMLAGKKRMLKPLLLDQAFIAGIGNIYADEALWGARLHPERRADTLTDAEVRALHRAIPKVLKQGIKNLGTTLGTGKTTFYSVPRRKGRNREALKVFRRTGQPCPRCRAAVRRLVVGQRGTHICPECQPHSGKSQITNPSRYT